MNFHQKPIIHPGTVYLNVTNIDVSKEFYTNIIGLAILHESEREIAFTTDHKTALLVIEQPENVTPKEARKTGLYHFAILLPTRKDLGALLVHFAKNNIQIGAADHLVSEALYLNDPDGNGIEIYIDREPSVWKWTDGEVAMATDPIDAEGIVNEAEGDTWKGLPAGTVMGHIHLHVDNLQQAQLFYEQLGFQVVSHLPQALFMSHEKYHHHVAINTWNGVGAEHPASQSAGLKAFTLIYPDNATLESIVTNLSEKAKKVNNQYEVNDPAGNKIILTVS